MNSIVSDPTTLTKDKLKRELSKRDIKLPPSDAKKDVYVELYRLHVLKQTSEFSADEAEINQQQRRVSSHLIVFYQNVDVGRYPVGFYLFIEVLF